MSGLACVLSTPEPWQPVLDRRTPIGGLLGIGFAVRPDPSCRTPRSPRGMNDRIRIRCQPSVMAPGHGQGKRARISVMYVSRDVGPPNRRRS